MKANDLRLRNWVRSNNVFVCVEKILSDKYGYCEVITRQMNLITCRYELLNGIPLTEEILLACGITFHHVNGFRKYFNYKNNIMIEILNNKQVCVYFMDNILCFKTYLHELQNLFKIWDIELEINL